MADFPTLTSGTVAAYPLQKLYQAPVQVVTFQDGSEQRWAVRKRAYAMVLTFSALCKEDADTILEFWQSTKGDYDHTWNYSLDALTLNNCFFDMQDRFTITEQPGAPGLYQARLVIRQRWF